MPEAVIVDAIRTPIGRAGKASLKTVRADDLAAIPLKALIERNPELEPGSIVDVLMGCAFGAGEQGYNIGRNAALLAGIDHHVPACTLTAFCASSLHTIRMAFHPIQRVAVCTRDWLRAAGRARRKVEGRSRNSTWRRGSSQGRTARAPARGWRSWPPCPRPSGRRGP